MSEPLMIEVLYYIKDETNRWRKKHFRINYHLKVAITLIFTLLINDLVLFSDHQMVNENQTELFKILEQIQCVK
jgi:hypothetical protein